jgi:hypothetical protein
MLDHWRNRCGATALDAGGARPAGPQLHAHGAHWLVGGRHHGERGSQCASPAMAARLGDSDFDQLLAEVIATHHSHEGMRDVVEALGDVFLERE